MANKITKLVYSMMVFAIVLGSVMSFGAQSVKAAPAYDYQLISQSAYPATLAAGATTNVYIEVKNTGTAVWGNTVRLGAGSAYGASNQQRDYSSEFANSDWPSANRPAGMSNGTPVSNIQPGWVVRFQFNIKAPTTAGTYKAYFTPVADGVTWMKDIGIFWQITVSSDGSSVIIPITGTGLGVALASDSPVSGSVAILSQNAVFTKISLTAGSGSAVTVNSIKVKKSGVSADASLSAIKLYDGATQVGSTQGLNLTYATFSQLALVIPAGTTKTLTIKANVSSAAGGATASSTIALGVNAVTDIVLSDTAIAVSGSFPVTGNTRTIANLTAGNISAISTTGSTTIAPGSTDNNLGTFTFTAANSTPDDDIYLDAVTLTTSGSVDDSAITNIKLKDGATVVGTAASIINRKAIINLNPDVKITDNGSKILTVTADIGSGIDTGRTVILSINRNTDVIAYGSSSGGDVVVNATYPVTMSTSTTAIGSLIIATGPNNPSETTYVRGTVDRNYFALKISAPGEEGVKITELTITGTAGSVNNDVNSALNSIKLFDGTNQIGSTSSLSGGSVTFYLSTPLEIAKGASKEIMVKASVSISDSADAAGAGPLLKVNNVDTDITAYGLASGIQLAAASMSGTATGAAHGIATKGTLVVSLASGSTPASTLSPGTTGVVFTKFDLTAGSGEDIDVSAITVRSFEDNSAAVTDALDAGEITNVKLMDGTTQLGSTVATPTLGVANFSMNLRVAAGTTKTLSIVADVPATGYSTYAKFAMVNATIDTDITSTGVMSTADVVETGLATGNKMTVALGTIVASMTAVPVVSSIVKGSADVVLGNIVLTAGTAENVVINSIKVSNGGNDATGTNTTYTDVTNLKLFDSSTGLQVGDTVAALTNAAEDTASFSSLAVTVAAGTQKVLTIKGTIPAGAATKSVSMGINGEADITGTGVKSNAAITGTTSTTTGVYAPIQTIAANATLTLSNHSSTPINAIVVPGSSKVDYAVVNLYTDNEDAVITDIVVTRVGGVAGDFAGVYIIDGATTYGPVLAGGASADTYTFSSLAIPVTKKVNKQIKISAMLNPVGEGAVSGGFAYLGIANTGTDVIARGALSNIATSYAGTVTVNKLLIRKAKPVVTLAALPTTTLSNTTVTLAKFSVLASGGDIALKKLSLGTLVIAGTSPVLGASIKIYDMANSATALLATVEDGSGATTFTNGASIIVKFTTMEEIAAGQSKTYEVKGTVSGSATAGDTIQTRFSALHANEDGVADVLTEYVCDVGSALSQLDTAAACNGTSKQATFIWSDKSATTTVPTSGSSSSDWTNGYLLNLPTDYQSVTR